MNLRDKDLKYIWHPFTQAQIAPVPVPIVKAEGVWLYDETGKKYLDANSSWWTILHGHCHPYIGQKLKEQFNTLDHSIFAGATHPKAAEVGERIVGHLPKEFAKVFFSDNGSTAVEVGLKVAIQYFFNQDIPKRKFVAIEGAYHGDTFGAMSVGQRGYFNKPFEELFFEVEYIPFPTEDNYEAVIQQANSLFESGDVAGFIFEPLVQGAAGMRIYKAEWLNELVRLAKKNGVITIADEVMTGFYRTGKMFAIDHIAEDPDIVCMSKGLTGGVMPMGLTAMTHDIYNAFLSDEIGKALLHGHSFTANPLGCSTVCASLDLLEKEETQVSVQRISDMHQKFCMKHAVNPHFKSVKSQGTILSLEVEVGEGSSYFSSIRTDAYNYFLENNILLRPLGNIIFFNPPYVIKEEELNFVYDQIITFVEDWKARQD
jgi:adenosylmethionine-8-amino-7-oxononanoate aminotransferase